ncbi:uncharacterized protein BJ171DRAFT_408273, partial [Polychytrium aggregatum]|uniref:uncharacterized protein n=1 Tax=Polychytrium aggregatum TaxID=110093 RepID=UPI0022FE6F1B
TVSCARIATQADELGISVGEEITVIEVYDDGWGLAMNGHGEQGMIPMNFL